MKVFNKINFSLEKHIPWLLLQSNVLSCLTCSVEEWLSSLWLPFCPWGWNRWRSDPNFPHHCLNLKHSPSCFLGLCSYCFCYNLWSYLALFCLCFFGLGGFFFKYLEKYRSFPCAISFVRLQGNSTVCHSSSTICTPLLWVTLLLLLLPASVEFTLNSYAEDIIFGNYSFCHNLSVLASDHLGNKRMETGKPDFTKKWPHQCLHYLYVTAMYNISMSSSRKANILSA